MDYKLYVFLHLILLTEFVRDKFNAQLGKIIVMLIRRKKNNN